MGASESVGILDWDPSVVPTHGIKVASLELFIQQCGGREGLNGKTTTDVCIEILKPLTEKSQSSLCDLLRHLQHEAFGEKADVFISHAWQYKFLDVVDALLYHFRDQPDTVIWFDLFSNNQHKTMTIDFQTTFKSAIADFKHTVMVLSPWHNPIPYTRAWCIFEAYCSASTNCKFEIAMSEKEQKQFLEDINEGVGETIYKMLATIDARKSKCEYREDRDKIFSLIKDTVGFNAINSMVFEQFRDWVIKTCDNHYLKLKTALGDNDPNTLASMNNLVTLYSDQGKYDLAEPLCVSCLEKRKTALGDDDPDTLGSMQNLAALYFKQEKYDLAEPLWVSCLEKRKTALWDDHPDTLRSMNNLATLYSDQGKYDLAEPLLVSCLEKTKSVLGDDDRDTLRSMNNLADHYFKQGEYDLAEPLWVSCLEKRKTALGDDDPDTLGSMNNLAGLYFKQGEYDLTEALYVSCLEKRKTVLGDDHPDILGSMNNLAGLYFKQGKYDLAEPLWVSCLEKRKTALWDDHPDTLRSMNNLAGLYFKQGKYDLAEPLLVSCLEKRKTALEDNDPDILGSMNNLASLYFKQGKYDLVVSCLEKLGKLDLAEALKKELNKYWVEGEESSLFKAVVDGKIDDLRTILDRGVNPSLQDSEGMTPLHYAADRGNCEVLEVLLSYGANANVVDSEGQTALMLAVLCEYEDIVRILMKDEIECDITIRNNDGESALDMVDSSSGEGEAIRILLQENKSSA